jgi:hypothetical protein
MKRQALVDLVHPDETQGISAHTLIDECTLFERNLGLLGCPYHVTSDVPVNAFRAFISALEGKSVEVTDANFRGLSS